MKRLMVAFWVGTALCPVAANAQSDAADSADAAPGDIIVTAQRYEQRLQDVPVSISAIGADELASRGATSLGDLQYSVPGLSLYEYGPGKQVVQLRGMANIQGASTVGVYLDETPLALDIQGDSISVRLLDMERVEVLRGPQATLYGEGSMGGTIRYIPAAPKLGQVSGSAEGEYSKTRYGGDGYKGVGVINLPLGEIAAVRLVGGYERGAGWIDNVTTGDKNVNAQDLYTVRGSLLVEPTDQLSLSLMGLYQKSDQANQDFGVNRQTTVASPAFNKERYTLVQGKFDYDLGGTVLAGSLSYIDRSNRSANDLSPFYVPVLTAPRALGGLGLAPGFIDQVTLAAGYNQQIFNSELRLASHGESAIDWSLGINYRELKNRVTSDAQTAPNEVPADALFGDGRQSILYLDQRTKIRYLALYGEVTGTITPELKVTAGVRYFHERKSQVSDSTNFGIDVVDINQGTFETVNPRLNISYEISPDSMVYASVAKGFRGGGFNLTSAGGGIYDVPPSFKPDVVWTYELGTKHQLFGGKLMLDASVYRTLWSDVQSYAFAPGSPITITTNSGDVAGWGVDLSAMVRPMPALTLSATYSWNNLEYKNVTADKLPGDPVDAAVPESWSASLDFRPSLGGDVTGIVRVDYQHAAAGQITLRNFGGQIIPRPGRDLVNARVGAAIGPVEVAVFANNLFNEDAPNIVGPFGVFLENLEQRPRTIGVNARMNF
ncbi:outer membrane receptor protein involved in Fe transport [Sphingopyxis panaciterrae]|uniref:TonB-dependent receptor n=1 Tax=Sphingopyxis panaciterrae TaxID=363841 RepID=UPI00141F41A9|nr:TonB-dependent receptor [Sphingopyxis panaciterrae]NIJ35643.1 outer membrane receptor protein involved in Fe transport [Sphingopyxis panaciterrae]